jgi:uncharacterized protein YdaU (DUF1376 family)
MSKDASAWMPLYVGDYLGDTQRLSTEQHGAYLLLILDYWRNGPAPDDDAVLQQITKLDRAGWKKHRAVLERMFQVVDGEWCHRRIDRELESAKQNQERRSSKAKSAAQARWGDASGNAPSMLQALPEGCPPPSPSPKKSTPDKSGVATQRANRLPPDFVVPPEWIAWAISDRSWSRGDATEEAASFVDFWHAKSGRDATKLDWEATWRNWCRNSRRNSRASQREWVSPC